MSRTRTSNGSVVAAGGAPTGATAMGMSCVTALAMATPPSPGLQCVDEQEKRERPGQHHDRQRGGARLVVLVELRDDEKRHDLRPQWHVSRDEHDQAILADRRREGE